MSDKVQTPTEDVLLAPPIALGTMLFSLVEPHPGQAAAFNRWYEQDHFYAGCMSGADFFSGRRFVATRDLKEARIEGHKPPWANYRQSGSYLNLYWILQGRRDPALQWSVDQVRRLARQGRMGPPTDSISTGFYDYAFGLFRDPDHLPAELALDHPFDRIVAVIIDRAPGADEGDFEQTLRAGLSDVLRDSPIVMSLCFRPLQLPPNAPRIAVPVPQEELNRRWLVLLFSGPESSDIFSTRIASLSQTLSGSGHGELRLAAPFRPIIPGVDDHSNQL